MNHGKLDLRVQILSLPSTFVEFVARERPFARWANKFSQCYRRQENENSGEGRLAGFPVSSNHGHFEYLSETSGLISKEREKTPETKEWVLFFKEQTFCEDATRWINNADGHHDCQDIDKPIPMVTR